MSSECGNFLKRRIFPKSDLIETVAMSGDDLIRVTGPHQVANLRWTDQRQRQERYSEAMKERRWGRRGRMRGSRVRSPADLRSRI
jgi:hypothetical protein